MSLEKEDLWGRGGKLYSVLNKQGVKRHRELIKKSEDVIPFLFSEYIAFSLCREQVRRSINVFSERGGDEYMREVNKLFEAVNKRVEHEGEQFEKKIKEIIKNVENKKMEGVCE